MSSLADYLAIVKHQNAVCVHNRAYSLRDNYVGYCDPEWYHAEQRRDEWENQEDPSWNYISVSDFIAKCDGVSPDQTEISLEGLL